jgi:hypothetical protein
MEGNRFYISILKFDDMFVSKMFRTKSDFISGFKGFCKQFGDPCCSYCGKRGAPDPDVGFVYWDYEILRPVGGIFGECSSVLICCSKPCSVILKNAFTERPNDATNRQVILKLSSLAVVNPMINIEIVQRSADPKDQQ